MKTKALNGASVRTSRKTAAAKAAPTVPLQVVIQHALRIHKTMTIEEIERVALGCTPIPSKKEVETTLKKLVEGKWISKWDDDLYAEYEAVNTTGLKLEPNAQTKKALAAIRKANWDAEASADDSQVALYVLLAALQHPEKVSEWIRSMCNYTEAEDLGQLFYMYNDIEAKAAAFEAGGEMVSES
jgi:hypothetical protein